MDSHELCTLWKNICRIEVLALHPYYTTKQRNERIERNKNKKIKFQIKFVYNIAQNWRAAQKNFLHSRNLSIINSKWIHAWYVPH